MVYSRLAPIRPGAASSSPKNKRPAIQEVTVIRQFDSKRAGVQRAAKTFAKRRHWQGLLCAVYLLSMFATIPAFGQYNAGILGTVLDSSGAAVPGAQLTLTDRKTAQARTVKSDPAGRYQFLSLAPGQYQLEVQMGGFAKTTVSVTLETNQNLDVPLSLKIAAQNSMVTVTGAPPVLDTAETRNELTIESDTVNSLPLPGRNMVSLVTMAPGVTGLGVVAGGSPGSAADNYSTETQVDTSANGQGAVGNMYIVDGLDVTSAIRAGV